MSLYYLLSLGIVSVAGYYYQIPSWISKKYRQLTMMKKLLDGFDKVDCIHPKQNEFFINDTDLSADIYYERMNSKYRVSIPFNRKYIVAMSQFKAELLYQDGTSLDITQQPGIPYLVSAVDLGGNIIRITNQEYGVAYDYIDKPPMYAIEIMYSE